MHLSSHIHSDIARDVQARRIAAAAAPSVARARRSGRIAAVITSALRPSRRSRSSQPVA